MPISEQEQQQWRDAARRVTDQQTKRLTEAYGRKPSDDLRQAFRWIAANAPAAVVKALATAFEEVAGTEFHDGYLDGLDSAELTDGERRAHEQDLGFDVYLDDEDEDEEEDDKS